MSSRPDLRLELARRLAGALRGRRLYAPGSSQAERLLAALQESLRALGRELTLGLVHGRVALDGGPVVPAPAALSELASRLERLGIDVLRVDPEVRAFELEALLELLTSDPEDVDRPPAEWLSERGVTSVVAGHLKWKEAPGDARSTVWQATHDLGAVFERARAGAAPSTGAVEAVAKTVLDLVMNESAPLSALAALRGRGDFLLVHSVNVACVAGAQARALGLAEPEVEAVATAALTHDIGKARVPEAITAKRGPLLPAERVLLDRHAVEGARLLLPSGSPAAVAVAFGHHRPPDPEAPPLLALELTRIADAFDGLRSLVRFRSPDGRRGAVAWMLRHLDDRLNSYLFERFARLLDAAPAGSTGWLSTGEVVKVVEPHPELGLRPVVEVLDRRDGLFREGERVDLGRLAHQLAGPRLVPPVPGRFAEVTAAMLDDLG